MLPLHELHDVTEIVAIDVEMLLWASQRQTSSGIGGEITHVPTLYEAPKGGDPGMLPQSTKRRDPKFPFVVEFNYL